ncbi:molybdopterin-dependent oxidoreductase [Sphingomonas sp. M1-B02]|uniref:molybdopterin-dependent oxidoreductase n=1 Tax=Sphingomonas sp. M1-B02 TaxID=3114300 RepID=UPI00223F8F5E|nr:molybdopterin-dependent oxidoreductase [Sphingomonas sp. S6-11]UZK65627.1 molybdopterin-dependent oxidoreductase [Sphingomonas sp. S6-11]
MITRRTLLVGTGATLLAGCDSLTNSPALMGADEAHRFLQRSITGRAALAREFRADQMSPRFRVNGTNNPNTPDYAALANNRFSDWRLAVDGLVARPLSLSLAQLQSLPQRAQITRHDCVEGWSAIGKWQGPRLETVLQLAGLRDTARYIVFHCADRIGGAPYYESIDLVDAFHPQTILAWAMNDATLSVGHGAPLRLRVERQLGYKHAKYVMRVQAVDSLAGIGGGKGGFWEDSNGYEWYAGI